MIDNYVNLHVHSDASLGDSIIKVPDLVRKVESFNQDYIALTDHASLMNHYSLQQMCNDSTVNCLYGNELYCKTGFEKPASKERFHLVLIAQNEQGLVNLRKLQRLSVHDHFYYKPLTPHELIFDNADGLFCSTACSLSYINNCFLHHRDDEAYDFFNTLLDVFGRSNVAIELQYHYQYSDQLFLNEKLLELYYNTDAKWLINTFDSHFINDEDKILRKKIQSIAWKKNEDDINDSLKSNCLGNTPLCYKYGRKCNIDDDIIQFCINNTHQIAEKCYFTPQTYDRVIPKFTQHKHFKEIFLKKVV